MRLPNRDPELDSLSLSLPQDSDGFHIAGLFLSFLHHYWPALVARGFLYRFVTPLVKATQKRSKAVATFYDLAAYEDWAKANDSGRYCIKYYKVSNRVCPLRWIVAVTTCDAVTRAIHTGIGNVDACGVGRYVQRPWHPPQALRS